MRALDPQSLTRHIDRLYRAAWALCGSKEEAEDLVQDTFARVLAKPRTLRGEDELAYLMKVLRNTFYSSKRTASRRPKTGTSIEDVAAADPQPTHQPEQALDVRELYAAVAQLPEDFRLALVAVDILGLSYREAATTLKAREATITTRLFRARRQVVKTLGVEPEPTGTQATQAAEAPPAPAAEVPQTQAAKVSQAPATEASRAPAAEVQRAQAAEIPRAREGPAVHERLAEQG